LVNVPRAFADVTIGPRGSLVLVRFSAESQCIGAAGTAGTCPVRILIGDFKAQPASNLDFAFDSTSNGTESSSWEAHSMDRSLRLAFEQETTVRVQVQAALSTGATDFGLDDWSLTIEKFE
jgi:hypothetical protein